MLMINTPELPLHCPNDKEKEKEEGPPSSDYAINIVGGRSTSGVHSPVVCTVLLYYSGLSSRLQPGLAFIVTYVHTQVGGLFSGSIIRGFPGINPYPPGFHLRGFFFLVSKCTSKNDTGPPSGGLSAICHSWKEEEEEEEEEDGPPVRFCPSFF